MKDKLDLYGWFGALFSVQRGQEILWSHFNKFGKTIELQPFQISHIETINRLSWSSRILLIQSYAFPMQYQDTGHSAARFLTALKNSITKNIQYLNYNQQNKGYY